MVFAFNILLSMLRVGFKKMENSNKGGKSGSARVDFSIRKIKHVLQTLKIAQKHF